MDILKEYFKNKNKKKNISSLVPLIEQNLCQFLYYYDKFSNNKINPINIEETKNGYIRNYMFIDEELDFEIILIEWKPDSISPIHNHADKGCVMLLLDGSLIETRYKETNKGIVSSSVEQILKHNVSFIENKKGIHKIENISKNNSVFSLHIYSPPKHKAKIF